MTSQQWMYNPTVSFTKSGGTFYVQQQQQASSRCHKFSNSNALSDKEYPSACQVYYIIRQSDG
jgi:hypothetical protein